MHKSAYDIGSMIIAKHWKPESKRILDIGSYNVNGTLRDFCPHGAEYVGIDLTEGPSVDLVLDDPYKYPFPGSYFDIVLSTSCFEHDPMFWLTFLEAARVLANGGILYINAPSNGHYHRHPWDNWRFYPDAAVALQMWGRRSGHDVSCIESFIMTPSGGYNDYVMIFSKGDLSQISFPYISDHLPDVVNVRRGVGQEVTKRCDLWRA
jgi:SAM-dependent methyltransferase